MTRPLDDVSSPQTTYGAPPRTVSPPFTAGENCLFVNDGSPTPAPRLPALGNGSRSMVPLTAAQLTDGPWCPDDANPNRWDADLLRIRRLVSRFAYRRQSPRCADRLARCSSIPARRVAAAGSYRISKSGFRSHRAT
jgi:hypothetical protein